jgi:predicted DNA-binding antitoxin AbrB/MazE fold protein
MKGGMNHMSRIIRARAKRGVFEPLEPVDVPEGTEVTITIPEEPTAEDIEAFRRSAGSWRGLVDADKLIADIYESRLTGTRPERRP